MNKPLFTSLTLGSALALGAASVGAESNPFAATELPQGYQLASAEHKSEQGKHGEAKCGAEHKKSEAKCGEGACGGDMKTHKSEEATCGGDMHDKDTEAKMPEGKCGEGACGGDA